MRRFLNFVIALCAVLTLFPLYTRFKVQAAPVPPGVYMGGIDMSQFKDVEEMRHHLEPLFQQPIEVYFRQQRLALTPQDVDFQLDIEQMVHEAERYLEGPAFVEIAIRYALGLSQRRRDIPVRFTLSNEKLRLWLMNTAVLYNSIPSAARVTGPNGETNPGDALVTQIKEIWSSRSISEALQPPPEANVNPAIDSQSTAQPSDEMADWPWIAGQPGYTLDVESSVPLVIDALTRSEQRRAALALFEAAPPPPTMPDLAHVLSQTLSQVPDFVGVYLIDLSTGEEAMVDPDVSFSGMSTVKILIAAAAMQKLPNGIQPDDPVSKDVGLYIDYALGESNNAAANRVLGFLGDGNVNVGASNLTRFAQSLGFVNTYMQSGYDANTFFNTIPTPGNLRSDWNTNPDSSLQSDPREMGLTLKAIYDCSQGTGLLLEKYPNDFTREECLTILYYMTHDEFQEMIWAGLPDFQQQWIVHKHGFASESHSDVALVWGPTGPYVLSIFIYHHDWMDWAISNTMMKAVSRITWNFFDYRKQLQNSESPQPFLLQPPPGYKQIKEYIPVVSTGALKEEKK